MAAPVFCPSEEYLRAALKLSTVKSTSVDTDATIDKAVLQVRLDLYRSLGKSRIDTISAGASWTETPSEPSELLLALGATTEINWCRIYLLRSLNALFMEGSGGARRDWNETPLMREQGMLDLASEIERLEADVQSALQVLRGDVAFGEDSRGGSVGLVGPAEDPPKPGRSVWPPLTYVWG